MKRYIFPITIYSILALISLAYALLAFFDMDLKIWTTEFDLYKLFMGLGCLFMCVHVIVKYIKADE